MKKSVFALLLFICLICSSCSFGLNEIFGHDENLNSRCSSIKHLSGEEVDEIPLTGNFNFVIFTDIHFGHPSFQRRETDFLNWLDSVQSNPDKKPSFCVSLGDNTDSGKPEEYDQYVVFTNQIKVHAGIKTYSVAGNHDLYNSGWKYYKEKVFPYTSFYKFSTEEFSFYFIDSASGSLGLNQYNSLCDEFSKDSKNKLLFSHFPLTTEGDFYFRMQNLTERNRLLALMSVSRVKNFFSGHTHMTRFTDFGAFEDTNFSSISKSGKWLLVHVNQTEKKVTYEVIQK